MSKKCVSQFPTGLWMLDWWECLGQPKMDTLADTLIFSRESLVRLEYARLVEKDFRAAMAILVTSDYLSPHSTLAT